MRISKSSNYSRFKFYRENRSVSSANVKAIAESIKEYGLICPIVVDKDFYIVDGQNRFEALKRLRYPVTFVLNTNADKYSVIQANVQKSWALTDYISFYAQDGNHNYSDLINYFGEYKLGDITLASFAKVFTRSITTDKDIRSNSYKIDPSFGLNLLSCLNLIGDQFDSALHSRFIITFKRVLLNNPKFSIKRFLKKMESKKLHLYSSTADTYESIIEVYNYKAKKGNIK